MNRRSQSIVIGFACLIAAAIVYTQAGCGGSSRQATIVGELAALKTARTAFHDWDVARQVDIAGTAPSREEGEKKLAEHQKFRDLVTRAFYVAFDQLAEAASKDDEPTLTRAREIAAAVIKGVLALKPGSDPPPDFPCHAKNLETQLGCK